MSHTVTGKVLLQLPAAVTTSLQQHGSTPWYTQARAVARSPRTLPAAGRRQQQCCYRCPWQCCSPRSCRCMPQRPSAAARNFKRARKI